MLLSTVRAAYDQLLTPVPPFTWFGSTISAFDVAAALRLCIVLRQLREAALRVHLKTSGSEKKAVEEKSYVKYIATTLATVYGGEAIMNPWLGLSPSFIFSPVVPALYSVLTILVELTPSMPEMSLFTELPLSFLDGLTRAFLLCQLIPPAVVTHTHPAIASSPWTLLLTSLITANGGFFFVNIFSMLSPTGFSLCTPTELRAYGWTIADLWCAPLVTGLYALLTHAQPAWAELHAFLVIAFGGSVAPGAVPGSGVDIGLGTFSSLIPAAQAEAAAEAESLAAVVSSTVSSTVAAAAQSATQAAQKVLHEKGLFTTFAARADPLDPETARAACAVLLAVLFATRTLRNFGGQQQKKVVSRPKFGGQRAKGKVQ